MIPMNTIITSIAITSITVGKAWGSGRNGLRSEKLRERPGARVFQTWVEEGLPEQCKCSACMKKKSGNRRNRNCKKMLDIMVLIVMVLK